MVLPRKVIEREVAASKAALKAHEEGAKVHKIVVAAFEKELEKYPESKKEAKKP